MRLRVWRDESARGRRLRGRTSKTPPEVEIIDEWRGERARDVVSCARAMGRAWKSFDWTR